MKRFGLISFLVLITAIFVGCSTAEENPKKVDGEKTNTEEKQEKTVFAVGEAIKLKDNQLTVTSVEKSAGGEFDSLQSGNEYVIVNVTIKNAGNENISYNPYDFQLKNSNGNIVDGAFAMINQDTQLQSGELAAGGEVSGSLAFEAPVGDENLELIYKPSFWSDKNITVKLQ